MADGPDNSKLLIMAGFPRQPAPIREPSRSAPRVPSLESKMLLGLLRQKFTTLLRVCVSDGVKNQIVEQEMLFVFLSLWKEQGFKELCARKQGQISRYIFSIISH